MNATDLSRTTPREFSYETFVDASTQIRLLRFDSYEDDDVRCSIATFEQRSAPPYVAISYTWGPESDLCDILVNGRTFTVRANCQRALQQVFWQMKGTAKPNPDGDPAEGCRYLWIDSICINQADLNEKTAQIGKMSTIYNDARLVLSSLGTPGKATAAVIDIANTLEYTHDPSDPGQYPHLRSPFAESRYRHWTEEISTRNQKIFELGFKYLGSRAYWYRLWIVPEIMSARGVYFLCGNRSISARRLEFFIQDCSHNAGRDWLRDAQWLSGLNSMTSPIWRSEMAMTKYLTWSGFLRTISHTAWLRCGYPRDRVNAFVSMMIWPDGWRSKLTPRGPNYNMHPVDYAVYLLSTYRHESDDGTDDLTYVLEDATRLLVAIGERQAIRKRIQALLHERSPAGLNGPAAVSGWRITVETEVARTCTLCKNSDGRLFASPSDNANPKRPIHPLPEALRFTLQDSPAQFIHYESKPIGAVCERAAEGDIFLGCSKLSMKGPTGSMYRVVQALVLRRRKKSADFDYELIGLALVSGSFMQQIWRHWPQRMGFVELDGNDLIALAARQVLADLRHDATGEHSGLFARREWIDPAKGPLNVQQARSILQARVCGSAPGEQPSSYASFSLEFPPKRDFEEDEESVESLLLRYGIDRKKESIRQFLSAHDRTFHRIGHLIPRGSYAGHRRRSL